MKRWLNRSAIGSLVFLVALYLVLFNRFGPEKGHGLVWKLRRPGQMSVIEALAMEMEAMKPPEGVLPVATEIVKPRPFEITVTYTGTVAPLNEEVVIARVTGRLTWMPYYAGDRIRKGQLVARLDNAGGEYAAREAEAAYGALAALHERHMAEAEKEQARAQKRQAEAMIEATKAMRRETERMVAEKQAMRDEALSMVRSAESEVLIAEQNLKLSQAQKREAERIVTALESELQTVREQIAEADAELERARQEVDAAKQELAMAQADLNYWQAEIERAKTLYEQKAISKDELQREQAQFETAQAKVRAAEAKVRQAEAMVRAAEAKKRQAQNMLRQKEAELAAAKERVAQMQAMVEMAQAKLAQAKAMAQAAQAKLRQAEAALQATQAKLAQVNAEIAKAQAMVQEAEANLHRGERHVLHAEALRAKAEAALTTARILRGYTEIRALTDGYVVERLVAPGTLVTAGTPILRIAQLDIVRVQAFVGERDLADIRLGTPVIVQSLKDGKEWSARITAIFPSADPTTRTGLVEALVPNIEGTRGVGRGTGNLKLLPGQSVVIKIVKRRIPDAITVPNEAITQFNGQPAVWVAEPMGETGKTEYTCPMHPEVRSDKPDKCPKCGMDLVPTKRYAPAAKTEYICPMHPEVRSDKPGKCHKCGMDLVPTKRHVPATKTEYTCPMHPEVRSDKKGKCPKCGMELVPTKRQTGETKLARLRVIRTGETDGQRTLVLSGLKAGDEVIVRGWQSIVREGVPVVAVEWNELGPAQLPSIAPSPMPPTHQHGGAQQQKGGGHQHGH
ncbi:RND family efflux transporter, MFP subunit [Candidatus Fervidibacteria bacterium JGI MDM2 SSWTFF-3-K9]